MLSKPSRPDDVAGQLLFELLFRGQGGPGKTEPPPNSHQAAGSEAAPAELERHFPDSGAEIFTWWPALASGALFIAANVLVLAGWRVPLVAPAIGFWLILVHPVYLLSTSALWRRAPAAERVGYSVAVVILALYLCGLIINVLLPIVGIRRPLDTIPVLIIVDAINILFYLYRRRRPERIRWNRVIGRIGQRESRLLVGAAACVPLAVLGANHLNNGAGNQVSFAGLACVVVTLALLLLWRRWIRDGLISIVLYLVSLSLLLATSLRGWSVTGHDIQLEYLVFQLTASRGHWSMANFPHSDYNACLSITILPTEMSHLLHIFDPDIYKFYFQIFFALCPVLVYLIARRHWSRGVSILGVIYFIGFPTFWEDMAYENRQEIGFVFVGVGILALSNIWWSTRQRRIALVVAALGVELSHYSTMYIFLGVLVIAWVASRISLTRIPQFGLLRKAVLSREPARLARRCVYGLGTIVLLSGILLAWGELATQTAGPALAAAKSSVLGLVDPGSSVRSQDVLYGVLHGSAPPPAEVLARYRQQTLGVNTRARSVGYLPASEVALYPTPLAGNPSQPLTTLGRLLTEHGVSASALNSDVRRGAAKDEQLFLVVGLIAIVASARLRRMIASETVMLSIGSIVVLGLITVLPALSVEYGVERVFLEALIVTAPVLAWGSVVVFSLFGGMWSKRAAVLVCFGFLVSTIGLMPEILGGYPPQLNLNNSGEYYDVFYVHPQEVAAAAWLHGEPGVLPDGLQASFSPERFYATAPSNVTSEQAIGDIYPTLVSRSGWLLLDYATMHLGIATLSIDGDLVNYHYPIKLIELNKNLVYNNGGSEIFK